MKRLIYTLCATLLSLAAYAQTKSATEVELPDFESIEINGDIKINLSQLPKGSEAKAVYSLNGGAAENFSIEVDAKGVLKIEERHVKDRVAKSEVTLYYSNYLKEIKSSMADIWIDGCLEQGVLDIDLNTKSKLSGDINLMDLKINLSGKSFAQLTGVSRYLEVVATGSNVIAYDLKVMSARVSASQKANVEVTANDRLEVSTTTYGDIYYRGDPSVIRTFEGLMAGEIVAQEETK